MSTWITPVTNRTSNARMTYKDMNRIAGNLDYLTEELTALEMYHGTTISKLSWTRNDYVTRAEWTNILSVLADVLLVINIRSSGEANYYTTYSNINTVEDLTRQAYERLDIIRHQGPLNHYVDTEIYVGEGYNVGGVHES